MWAQWCLLIFNWHQATNTSGNLGPTKRNSLNSVSLNRVIILRLVQSIGSDVNHVTQATDARDACPTRWDDESLLQLLRKILSSDIKLFITTRSIVVVRWNKWITSCMSWKTRPRASGITVAY